MKKEYILITGATGFIGSHVVDKLLEKNQFNIAAIVRKSNNYKNADKLKQKGVILVEGNFYDKELIEKVFNEFPIQHILHIAALRGGGAGTGKDFNKVNVYGTEVLLEISWQKRIKKFVFCSSVGVLGTIPKNLPAGTTDEFNGDNNYHISKIQAEIKVHEYINKGLNAYILRPTITYGAEDNGFPITLVELIKKRLLILPFRNVKIHLLDVTCLAELMYCIISKPKIEPRVFIAADKEPISLKLLADMIYIHYFNKPYPSFLKLPNFIFKLLSFVFRITGNEKWLGRILLISKSWYYDTSETMNQFQYIPTITRDSFITKMGI